MTSKSAIGVCDSRDTRRVPRSSSSAKVVFGGRKKRSQTTSSRALNS